MDSTVFNYLLNKIVVDSNSWEYNIILYYLTMRNAIDLEKIDYLKDRGKWDIIKESEIRYWRSCKAQFY